MTSLTPQELVQWMKEQRAFQLVDVREQWEHNAENIGGIVVPVSRLMTGLDFFREDVPLVLYCEKGIRSHIATQRLEPLGFKNLYNLEGGMVAWREMDEARALEIAVHC